MNIQKMEKFFGGTKFAVIVIVLFSLYMIVGTFFESYYGTEYANRTIYKSIPFMLIQLGMFLSVFYALLLRLPPKKKLYGFYVIHIGLILVFIGSVATYISGIDGSMTLHPNKPTRTIALSKDVLYITKHDENKLITLELPDTAFAKNINQTYENIEVLEYLPYAEDKLNWVTPRALGDSTAYTHSSQYFIYNDNIDQMFTMSLHPQAIDFPATTKMGLLNVHYLPSKMAQCFEANSKTGFIIWNQKIGECYTPEQRKIEVQKTSTGKQFLVILNDGEPYSFFPDFSPWPVDEKLEMIQGSPIRVFSKKLFQEKPNLFLFGNSLAFYDSEKWIVKKVDQEAVELPWMDFKIKLLRHETNKMPEMIPEYQRPIQVNNELIAGKTRALKIKVQNMVYWVKNTTPISLVVRGKKISFEIGKQQLKVPFEINLTKFKMDKDPGTDNPASFESFVNVFTGDSLEKYHVYMNNPLKYANFTFYQASYFKINETTFGSVFSVNFDPGRWLKYLGSLLIVLGAVWHFVLRQRKLIKPKSLQEKD